MNQDKKDRIKTIIDNMSDEVGIFGDYNELAQAFFDGLRQQHRTHQQDIVRVFLGVIERVAKGTESGYGTDGRNESSQKICKQMIDAFQKEVNPTGENKEIYMPSKWLGTV